MHTIFHSQRLTITSIPDELACDVSAMHKHLSPHGTSVGRPVPNTNAYILDEKESPLSIGSTGVMWEGGCMSRGYGGSPDETAKKYKVDRFVNDGYESCRVIAYWR